MQRQFLVLLLFFTLGLMTAAILKSSQTVWIWCGVFGALFLLSLFVKPFKLLLLSGWMMLGLMLSAIMFQVTMTIMFFLIITPMGLFVRKKVDSDWMDVKRKSNFKDQF